MIEAKSDPHPVIVIALSGGVDSSVAAARLQAQGNKVIAVTLKLHSRGTAHENASCGGSDGVSRARAAAAKLGIAHYELNCETEFDQQILRPAWEEYGRGRTPSPCLWCNERIKFGVLMAWARQFGAGKLATGHYAKISWSSGNPVLSRGEDPGKDQSYFLAGLTREQLADTVFPLGDLRKRDVREIARGLDLETADARDSQDACLVGRDGQFAETLRRRFAAEAKRGVITSDAGQPLGRHPGIHLFTVGQRRGLGINTSGRCWVRAVDGVTGVVSVTLDERKLHSSQLVATGINWLGPAPLTGPRPCQVQVRYRHTAAPAVIEPAGPDAIRATFDQPVRAITPGQAAVFYDGTSVLGRGWIV